MSEFLEKEITSKIDFDNAIVQYLNDNKIDTELIDGSVQLQKDMFDDGAIDSHWTAVPGAGSITEANNKITIIKNGYLHTTRALYLNYTFKYSFKVTAITAGAVYAIYSWAYPAFPTNYITRMWQSSAGNIYITYVVGVNTYYWDGINLTWGTAVAVAYAGAVNTLYKFKMVKDSLNYTMTLYNSADTLLITAIIPVSVIGGGYNNFLLIGDIASPGPDTFTIEISDLLGLYSRKNIGIITNIADLTRTPLREGKLTEDIDANLYDVDYGRINYSTNFAIRANSAYNELGQGFKLPREGIIGKIRIFGGKSGTIETGKKVWAEIWSDDGTGKPGQIYKGYKSQLKEANDIVAQMYYLEFEFNSSGKVLANTQYHLILNGDYAFDIANCILVGVDNTAASYPDGRLSNFDGVTWNFYAPTDDMIFGIQLKKTNLISRSIGYSIWEAYKTLKEKADFEGYSQYGQYQDTASEPGSILIANIVGVYHIQGYNQNTIDIGQVPTEYLTLSAIHYKPEIGTTNIKYYAHYSDDNIIYYNKIGEIMQTWWCKLESLSNVIYPEWGYSWLAVGGAPTFVACKFGNGIYIDADTEYLVLYVPNLFITMHLGSIEMWIKPDAGVFADTRVLIDSRKSAPADITGIYVYYEAGTTVLHAQIWSNGVVKIDLSYDTAHAADQLIHVGITWNDNGGGDTIMKLYTDNVLRDSDTVWVGVVGMDNDMIIGNDKDLTANCHAHCVIDNIKVYYGEKANFNDKETEDTLNAEVTMTNGSGDLTTWGKHRYWKIREMLFTTDTAITPKIYSITVDAFSPLKGISLRDKIEKYRYIKMRYALMTDNPEDTPVLNSYLFRFREAYELFIKKVVYKISSSGIRASMSLTSKGVGYMAKLAYGQAYRTSVYDIAAANTWYNLNLDGGNNDLVNILHDVGVNPDRISVVYAGVYRIKYTVAYKDTGGVISHGSARLTKNDVSEIMGSYSISLLPTAQTYDHTYTEKEVIVTLAAGDFITLQVGSGDAGVDVGQINDGTSPDPTTFISSIVTIEKIG